MGWEEAGYNYLQNAYFVYKEKTFKTKSQLSEFRKKGTLTVTDAALVVQGRCRDSAVFTSVFPQS